MIHWKIGVLYWTGNGHHDKQQEIYKNNKKQ